MRCYSHLSDDKREQIGLAKALGHSIGAIAQAIGRPIEQERADEAQDGRFVGEDAGDIGAPLDFAVEDSGQTYVAR